MWNINANNNIFYSPYTTAYFRYYVKSTFILFRSLNKKAEHMIKCFNNISILNLHLKH